MDQLDLEFMDFIRESVRLIEGNKMRIELLRRIVYEKQIQEVLHNSYIEKNTIMLGKIERLDRTLQELIDRSSRRHDLLTQKRESFEKIRCLRHDMNVRTTTQEEVDNTDAGTKTHNSGYIQDVSSAPDNSVSNEQNHAGVDRKPTEKSSLDSQSV